MHATPRRVRQLRCGRFSLSLDRPLLMGIINVTPDSFSDGGRHARVDAAIDHAHRLIEEGADILDIGGESTRPGSAPVDEASELRRVLPVLEGLRDCGRPLSIDTRHTAVMRECLAIGVDMINDVNGFRDDGAIEAVASGNAALCVMHMLGEPRTMQAAPRYHDVVREVADFLEARCRLLMAAGVESDRIVLDPGIGFGKSVDDNLRLLRSLGLLARDGHPMLVGLSRKSLIGHLTGRDVAGRLAGSVGGALAAAARGAAILRVHDIAPTRDALAVWQTIFEEGGTEHGA